MNEVKGVEAFFSDLRNHDSLDDFATAMLQESTTEQLYVLLERLEGNPYITVIENELKKRGELL